MLKILSKQILTNNNKYLLYRKINLILKKIMGYNIWTIERTLQKHIWIINSEEDFTWLEKIETFEEWCKKAIEIVMLAEWPVEEKDIICNRINEILEQQRLAWLN